MRDVYILSVAMIALTCCNIASVESKEESIYIKMPVRILNRIEEHSFRRTNLQEDAVNFIGLCVDNDDVNARVIKQFSAISATDYSKYFASEEFLDFAKSKLGSVPRIVCPPLDLSFSDDPRYWRSHKFLPNSIVIFPDSKDLVLDFKFVDATGIAQWEQLVHGVSIRLSLITFRANRKRKEQLKNEEARVNRN